MLALVDGELGRRPQIGIVRVELQLQPELPGEILDRADVGEGLGKALAEEPFERAALDGYEVREWQDLVEVGKEKRSGVRERDGKGLLLANACQPSGEWRRQL